MATPLTTRSPTVDRKTVALVATIAALAIGSAIFLPRNIDFAVYWYGVRDFLSGKRPLYGPWSGIGYPQEFRYPPLTLLFFLPLTWLPLRIASACWIVLAWASCAATSALAIKKWNLRFTVAGGILAAVLLAPYIVLAVRFGNVQPHLIALVLLSIVWSEEHPVWSGVALATAVCFKIWPLFFVPWFLFARRRATLYYMGLFTVILWAAPVLYFGWTRYILLVEDFFTRVVSLASSPESVWYSSQSLRGVLLRLLTHSVQTRDGYPDVSFAGIAPPFVSASYVVIAILIYGYAVFALWRSSESGRYVWDAAGFVLFSALQPFCLNSSLISLLPAILVAAHIYSFPGNYPRASRAWFLATCALSIFSMMTFYRPLQRLMLMWGIYFWIMLTLGVCVIIAARSGQHWPKASACNPI